MNLMVCKRHSAGQNFRVCFCSDSNYGYFKLVEETSTMTTREKLWKYLKTKYATFLVREQNPSPLLYFALMGYFHLYSSSSERPEPNYVRVTFFSCIVLAVYFRFNALYVLAPFARESSLPLAWLMFITCAFSCNKKWKAFLLLLASGVGFLEDPFNISLFALLGSTIICGEVWRGMLFDSWNDNVCYFTGFIGVAVY